MEKHRLYHTWNNMMQRCYNVNNTNYDKYGARGITVCEEWHDVRKFIEDMYLSFEEGLTLDRRDNDLGYNKDNCRWVDKTIQSRNTRTLFKHNTSGYRGVHFNKDTNSWRVHITLNGKSKHLGLYKDKIDAAKAYEIYVRVNKLEHNYCPVLSEVEIEELGII